MYLARRGINKLTTRRELVDCSVEEGDDNKGAPWVRRAFKDNHDAEAGRGVGGKDVSEVLGGGGKAVATGEGYVWKQDEEEIEITVIIEGAVQLDKKKVGERGEAPCEIAIHAGYIHN